MAKFCFNCGADNPDDGRFCRNCGAALPMLEQNIQKKESAGSGAKAPAGVKKPLNKKLIIGLAAAAAAVIIIIVLVMNMGKTLNLTDYVEIEYNGPSGYASASASLNYDKLSTDVLKALGYSEKDIAPLGAESGSYGLDDIGALFGDYMKNAGKYAQMMKDMQTVDEIQRNTEIVLDKTENISNGDKIKATVTYNGKNGKLNVKGGEKTFDAADLMEAREIDPFEKIEVVFSGVEPYGVAELKNTEAYYDYDISYSMDKYDGLSVGDKVTVTISYDRDRMLEQGYYITADSKEYTVDKLDEAEKADLFEGINVIYEGTAPFARAYLENSSRYVNNGKGGYDVYVSFEIENPDNLDTGDTVTVKASYDADEMSRQGIAAISDTKDYTVENIDSYIRKCSAIDSGLSKHISSECKDKLDAYLANLPRDRYTHSGEKYAGAYLLIRKQTNDSYGSADNMAIYLFKGNIRSSEEDSEFSSRKEVFYAFVAENIVLHPDKSQSYDESSLQMIASDNEIDAFTSGDEVFTELVVKNKDGYTYDVSNTAIKNGAGGDAAETAENGGSDAASEGESVAEETPAPTPEPAVTEKPAQDQSSEVEAQVTTPTPAVTEAPVTTPAAAADIPTEVPAAINSLEIPIQYGLYAPASDFIFPLSSTEYLTYDQINAALWNDDQNTRYRNGQLAINEILARYGYNFDPNSERIGARDAAEKFGGLEWYKQAVPNCTYDEPYSLIAAMNEVEKSNIKAITDWQYANDAEELK